MDEQYLIPANSKKSQLLFGMFTKGDLIIFGIGVVITFIMMMSGLPNSGIGGVIITILPAGIAALLVFPVPNYHNVLKAIIVLYEYFTKPKKFPWNGWSIDENDDFE